MYVRHLEQQLACGEPCARIGFCHLFGSSYFSLVEPALSAGALQPGLADPLVLGLFPVYLILSSTSDLGSRILGIPRASWASQQDWGGRSTLVAPLAFQMQCAG